MRSAVRPARRFLAPVVIAGMVLVGATCSPPPPPPGCTVAVPGGKVTAGFIEHVDDGWAICYPERMTFTKFTREGRGVAVGIAISTFDAQVGTWDQYWRTLRAFPSDGILMTFDWGSGPPGCAIGRGPDSSFPLDLSRLGPDEREGGGGSEPVPLHETVNANGDAYSMAVWIGPAARPQDRAAIDAVISTLRFLPVQQGQVLQRTSCGVFIVMGRPSQYELGSATEIDGESAAPGFGKRYFLVRVRRGFFALTWDDSRETADCDITFNPEAREFVCREMGIRWTPKGDPISRHKIKKSYFRDPHVLQVRISLDGHLLVTQNVGGFRLEESLALT